MKPGLRKVVALILASVTLFGSGASVVSAAYADDTTMGRPTRIQAEPGKTTTGGDEAAKNILAAGLAVTVCGDGRSRRDNAGSDR